jgi:hypothetical protein
MSTNTEHNFVDQIETVEEVSPNNTSFGGRKNRRNKTNGGKRKRVHHKRTRRNKRKATRRNKRKGTRRNKRN